MSVVALFWLDYFIMGSADTKQGTSDSQFAISDLNE